MDPMEAGRGSPLYSSTVSGENFRKDSMDADTGIDREVKKWAPWQGSICHCHKPAGCNK